MTVTEDPSVPVNYVVVVILLVIIYPIQTTNVRLDSCPANLGANLGKLGANMFLEPFLHLFRSVQCDMLSCLKAPSPRGSQTP